MGYMPGRCLLQSLLNQRGMTQQALSDKTGIPRPRISEYANTKRYMSLATAKTIAVILKVEIDDLYEWIKE